MIFGRGCPRPFSVEQKMRKLFAVIILCIAMAGAEVRAQERVSVAVLNIRGVNVSKIVANAMTDLIRSEMVKKGMFTIVERGQMNEILKEQGFQQSGCTDEACAVKVGKLLSAQKIMIGEMTKVGNSFLITVRIVDVGKGASEFAASEKTKSLDDLDVAGVNITEKLTQSILRGNKSPVVTGGSHVPAGYYFKGIVPGLAQFSTGQTPKGFIYSGIFLLTGAVAVYSFIDYKDKKRAYDDLPQGTAQDIFDEKYDDYKVATNIALYSGIIWGAAYIANWIDVLFISRPRTAGMRAMEIGAPVGYSFAWEKEREGAGMKVSAWMRF